MSVNIKTANGLHRFAGNTINTTATPLMSGLMSPEDKAKLDGIENAGMQIDLIATGYDGIGRASRYNKDFFRAYDLWYFVSSDSSNGHIADITPGDSVLIPANVLYECEHDWDVSMYWGKFLKIVNDEDTGEYLIYTTGGMYSIFGIKLKGQTASGGEKTLIIDSDSAEAETYTIVGSADATTLNLEMYGETSSSKGVGQYLVYSNGTKGSSSTLANLGATYITYAIDSNGVVTIGKKARVKLKVWATGSGYTVTKQ